MEKYIAIMQKEYEGIEEEKDQTFEQMRETVDQLLDKSIRIGEIKEALGIALETRRTDRVSNFSQFFLKICFSLIQIRLLLSQNQANKEFLSYVFEAAKEIASSKFKQETIRSLAQTYKEKGSLALEEYFNYAVCSTILKEHEPIVKLLTSLLNQKEEVC